MTTLLDNLRSATKNARLAKMGIADFHPVSFQCSKLTTPQAIEQRWNSAMDFQRRLDGITANSETEIERRVVFCLDNLGFAEQSPHQPLKVLHKLLENPEIAFVGLSNWRLDSAKMNRVVLHRVADMGKKDLAQTVCDLIDDETNIENKEEDIDLKFYKENENSTYRKKIENQLEPRIQDISDFYHSLNSNPVFEFDFHGHRDFYSFLNYLKYVLQSSKHGELTDDVILTGILRNFSGLTKERMESYLFPKIEKYIITENRIITEDVWMNKSPMQLIQNNIEHTNDPKRQEWYEIRNLMVIAENPAMWRLLFDAGIVSIKNAEVIFGSQFTNDVASNVYVYQTIERVKAAMQTGKVCVLLKLDQLYGSMYDMLNQRYLNVDSQKFCRICVGGESIRCRIAKTFRCVVVTTREEAYHLNKSEPDTHIPVAFLNRFEKYCLDLEFLQNKWKPYLDALKQILNRVFRDVRDDLESGSTFVGFNKLTYVSAVICAHSNLELQENCEDRKDDSDSDSDSEMEHTDAVAGNALAMLIRNTDLRFLINDRFKYRSKKFKAYSDLLDAILREGAQVDSKKHVLLNVITHDTYHRIDDFEYADDKRIMRIVSDDSTSEHNKKTEIPTMFARFIKLNDFNRGIGFCCISY